MESLKEEFISHEKRNFKFKLGHVLASSLSGFLAGIIVAVIVFLTLFDLTFKQIIQ
jgi:acid phosphatase family membrane protein YuiD